MKCVHGVMNNTEINIQTVGIDTEYRSNIIKVVAIKNSDMFTELMACQGIHYQPEM